MGISITNLKEGNTAIISHFEDEEAASRLMTMGVLPGSKVEVIRIAPFGGGYYLKIDGSGLVLRKSEAGCIMLKS